MRTHLKPLREFGCGDSGCIFGSPKGMATNGGCRCFTVAEYDTPYENRQRYRSAISEARKYEAELEHIQEQLEKLAMWCIEGGYADVLKKLDALGLWTK
jgi:hypothetical protein